MSQTVSDEYRPRRGGDGDPRARPVLQVLLCAWQPARPTSRHLLDDVAVVELGRGDAAPHRDGDRLILRVPDPMMSTDHGRLVRGASGWRLDDPSSKNGALIEGRPTRSGLVMPGELFELGHTVFRLDVELHPSDAALDLASTELAAPAAELATFVPRFAAELDALARVAATEVPVLVLGESGTGKEVVARALHAMSGRRGAFVAVNSGALSPQLVEAELFGHRRGAFSGAVADREGHLRSADGGTLFLDEIGDLPAAAQAALLRALQEREVVAVGDSIPTPVDFRLCAATHRDLAARVEAGAFRADLHARLLGLTVHLPPLRERRADLGLLIARLLARAAPGRAPRLTPAAAYALCRHDWPLNVRELERALAAAVALAGGASADPLIDLPHLPPAVAARARAADPRAAHTAPAAPPPVAPDDAERATLIDALTRHAGNVGAAARELGKHREQVHRALRRLGIDPARFRG